MAEKTFDQNFTGCILDKNISTLSSNSGVYGVYRCVFNKQKNMVDLKELIYIGKADNLNVRIKGHEKWDDWRKELQSGEQIGFCYTFIDKIYNERVEAALINSNKPRLNVEYKNAFPFDKTTVNCAGDHKLIKKVNIVDRH